MRNPKNIFVEIGTPNENVFEYIEFKPIYAKIHGNLAYVGNPNNPKPLITIDKTAPNPTHYILTIGIKGSFKYLFYGELI
jgi:hypothetical protein